MAIDLLTGRVTGRYVFGVVDGADTDLEPDMIPAAGTITFTASVQYLPTPGTTPMTVLQAPITGVLDAEGYLCTPSPTDPKVASAVRGVRLVATNNPTLPVQNWTWRVSYNFVTSTGQSAGTIIPQHSISVMSGTDLDLTTVVKVPESPAISITASEAAAGIAVQSALTAEEAVLVVQDYAAQIAASGSAAPTATTTTTGLMPATDKAKLDGSTAFDTAFALPVRNSLSGFDVKYLAITNAAPTGTSHATRKDYVDAQIATRAASSHTHTKTDVGLGNVDNTSDLAKPVSTATTTALAGKANTTHTHAKADVGLGNVDNTSDALKPVSTATQAALNGKAASSHTHGAADLSGVVKTVNGQTPNASGAVTITTGASSVAAADITDSTATGQAVITAATPLAARTAIGAGTGTSNLALGTTSTTAKAGNYTPTAADIPSGSVMAASKFGGVWQARPTSRNDVTVFFIGPDPSPPIITTGTAGMRATDIRIVTAEEVVA